MLIYGYIPKSKKRKIPKAQKEQYEKWLSEVNKPLPKFAKTSAVSSKSAVSLPSLNSKPFVRETVFYPSKNPQNMSGGTKPEQKQYTGDKILGIGTMHKSNAVPIFNDSEAKDISSMRR